MKENSPLWNQLHDAAKGDRDKMFELLEDGYCTAVAHYKAACDGTVLLHDQIAKLKEERNRYRQALKKLAKNGSLTARIALDGAPKEETP